MKKSLLLIFYIYLAVILSSSLVYAENKAGTVTLTLGDGYDYFSSKRHINNTSIPFVILGYNFTPRWGIEGLVGLFNTTFKPSENDPHSTNGTLVAVDGIYRFSSYKALTPFLLAGVGVTGFSSNRTDANNEGNINAGIGAQLFVDKAIAIRADLRDFYTLVGGENDVFIDVGLSFLFDFC